MNKPTVSAKWLKAAAAQLELDANANLKSWIVLGQSDKYSECMKKVRAMRQALSIKGVAERRAFLLENNIDA